MISTIKRHPWRNTAIGAVALGALATGCLAIPAQAATSNPSSTTTPIKHVVVIFSENVSFDHYFATYPVAANTDGTTFTAAAGTPTNIDTLASFEPDILAATNAGASNPNVTNANPTTSAGAPATQGAAYAPHRLSASQAWTTSQGHGYTAEQAAVNGDAITGKPAMNNFNATNSSSAPATGQVGGPGVVMGYYDGNTVTALWNYAQNYAMSDNSWDTTFGPSTVGALNLVAGQTAGTTVYKSTAATDGSNLAASVDTAAVNDTSVSDLTNGTNGTTIGDPDPVFDDCADSDHTKTRDLVGMSGKNIGDLLNAQGTTWGWFQGGFRPTTPYAGPGTFAQCDSYSYHWGPATATASNSTLAALDYSPHHEPFQYYASTANPHHLPPTSVAAIGSTDQANHQYDMSDFHDALAAGNLPSVSFLKAPAAQDGHPNNSTPLDEQKFITTEINALEKSPFWSSTAVVIAYDDSDGWYDHVAPVITNASNTADDRAVCTVPASTVGALTAAGTRSTTAGLQGRCGPSQRIPLLVVSPYSKRNYVDHTAVDQSSILQFIENNWQTGTIGGGSFDATAGSITGMFDFQKPQTSTVLLSTSNGAVIGSTTSGASSVNTTTALTESAKTQSYDQVTPVKLAAKVSGGTGTVAGSVAFYDGKAKLGTSTVSKGSATYSVPRTLAVGAHSLTAVFTSASPALASNSTSSKLTLTVVKATSKSTVKYASNRITVTVAASTPVTVGGKAKVYDGSKLIKTVSLSKGKASFADKLKKGTHKLKAVYAGTSTVSGSTSRVVKVIVKK